MIKKSISILLMTCISVTVLGQLFEFNWEPQLIKKDFNMKKMNVVDDNSATLVGYGNTFLQTSDQGVTWEKVPLIDPAFDWADISINSSGLGYAVAGDVKVVDNPSGGEPDVYADGVLLKTTDFGVTWMVADITEIGLPEDDPVEYPAAEGCFARHFRSVEVLEDNTVYLSAEWKFFDGATGEIISQRGTLKSADGSTWSPVLDGGYYSMFIESGATDIYYGGLNHLFRAEAGNDNVTDVYADLTTAAGDETVFVNDVTFASDELVFVVTSVNGIYVTQDHGATFELLQNGAPDGGNDMILVNDTVWMVLGTGSKSLITRDSGSTWEDCYPGATCYEIGGIMNDSIIGLGKSDIHKLAVADAINGNYSWTSQTISPDNNLQKMHVEDANTAIMVGYGNTLVSTADAGISWDPVSTPELHVYGGLFEFESISTSGNASWAVTRRLYVVDFPSSSPYSDLYAHGLIYKTNDNWETWDLIDYMNVGSGTDQAFNPTAEGCYGMNPYEIACVDASTAFLYVNWLDTIAGIDNKETHGNVFRTTDGGATWEPLFDDLKGSYMNHIRFSDANTGYIVGNTFFRKTTDGGDTFTDLYPSFQTTGSPSDSTIFLRSIEYLDDQNWYLLSSVDGVFKTTDGGASYSALSGIGGGGGMKVMDESTILVLGSSTKSKISWDNGESWQNCYPGSTIWSIGGILGDRLVALAKSDLYWIQLSELEAPSTEAEILDFILTEQTGAASINSGEGTISIEVESGTDVTALTPTIVLSDGASVSPASDTEQDFTDPVTYTVTAEDLSTSREWTVTVTVAVGIEDHEMPIGIYPNPAASRLYLENLGEVDGITIRNVTGSEVLYMETPGDKVILELESLDDGIYFISFSNAKGKVTSRKFIKQN